MSATGRRKPVRAAGDAPGSAARLLYWCDTTITEPFETGIQRVTRRLAGGLGRCGFSVAPVGWNARERLMHFLTRSHSAEIAALARPGLASGWLLIPEIPSSTLIDETDPVQIGRAYGLRTAAIVHDLIPIRLAHLYPPETVALFRRYFRMFARADLVFATTELVAGHLRAYLTGEGLRQPSIAVVPLPAQFADLPRVTHLPPARALREPLRLLTIATWEPRKNLPGLLRAVRRARERSTVPIALTLVGRRAGYSKLDAEVEALLVELPGCAARFQTSDIELAGLYVTHHASVYPSCEEGFGMPVLESLWLGRPCLCHAGSAMAEVAPGGGTLLTDMSDEGALADALMQMAEDPELVGRLTHEAQARPLRDWTDYAVAVTGRMGLAARA